MGYAARVMRGLIIDHARNRSAIKRGGEFELTALETDAGLVFTHPRELSNVSDALDQLAKAEPDLAEVVDLKFFCGFSFAEIGATAKPFGTHHTEKMGKSTPVSTVQPPDGIVPCEELMFTPGLKQWQFLSPYLDEAFEMRDHELSVWLRSCVPRIHSLAEQLETLLDEHRALSEEGFLEKNPIRMTQVGLAGHTVGPYTLISQIGQGGMGSVWLAERNDGRFERQVAVKFLNVALMGKRAKSVSSAKAAFLRDLHIRISRN